METKSPTLKELQTQECSVPELQAALVRLIELHDSLCRDLDEKIRRGEILSTFDTNMNSPYGL